MIVPAVRLDDLLGDREAEPGALRHGARLVGPVEAVEQPRDDLGLDADAVVGDRDRHAASRAPRRSA